PQLLGLRNGPPVIRFHGERIPAWLVTGYEQTRQVLRDERFSFLAPPEVTLPRPPGRHLDSDDPAHARLRQMLAGEFTAKRMRQLRPWIEKTVTQQLNDMERAGPPADLVSSFAQPVVSLVTCKLLGIPYPDFAGFERQRVLLSDEFANYLADLVARRRAEPGDGILGTLLRKYGSELTDQDTVNLLRLLVRVGRQPVIDVLTLGTALLLCNPRQLALLRDQPAVVDTAVEEITRYLTIGHRAPRTARTDVALGGEQIKAGDWVLCALVVANRSSALGADVDTLDLTRKPNRHLAFGHGIHHCIGAPLARMQMSIAYPALLRRFPSLRLAVPVEELPFPEFSYLYNLSSLPVTWDQNDKPAVPHVDVENSPLQTVTYVSNLNR
ncbi:MAG: cytochrome P450, partial [Mycobacterium sp.]|nr:cytochrome P450 [Mycobacterium sp.]